MRRTLRALSAWLSRIAADDRPPAAPFDAAVELARRRRRAYEEAGRRDPEAVTWWR